MSEMKTPKCPYCGSEMMFRYGRIRHPDEKTSVTDGYFVCDKCLSRAPEVSDKVETVDIQEFRARTKIVEKALAAALHRAEKENEQGNRVLTLEEVRNAEVDTFGTMMHWFELKFSPYLCEGKEIRHAVLAVSIFFEDETEDDEPDALYSSTGEPDSCLFQRDYGKKWRCWLRKPTEEEMEGTPWKS